MLEEIVLLNSTIAMISPPEERVQLSGISWTTYEASIDELGHRYCSVFRQCSRSRLFRLNWRISRLGTTAARFCYADATRSRLG